MWKKRQVMPRLLLTSIVLIFSFPGLGMAENYLQLSFETHTPALHEIARPGYTPVSIRPLRTQRVEWNKHDYAVLLYSVTLEETGFEGLESYLLNSKTNIKTKMEGFKVRSTNLDVPVLRVADINKDGKRS